MVQYGELDCCCDEVQKHTVAPTKTVVTKKAQSHFHPSGVAPCHTEATPFLLPVDRRERDQ